MNIVRAQNPNTFDTATTFNGTESFVVHQDKWRKASLDQVISGVLDLHIITKQPTGGHRILTNTGLYADNTQLNSCYCIAGITLHSAVADEVVLVRPKGQIIEPTWLWDIEKKVYLGANGLLTQNIPNTVIVEIGIPLSTTELYIDIKPPIVLTI